MSTFAMFWVVALLGTVSTVNAYRSLSFEVDANSYPNDPTFSEWSSENATFVYYSSCELNFQRDAEPKECIVNRLQNDFSETSPKEDRCNVKLHPQSGGWIDTFYVNIARMGEDRAILSWMEVTNDDHAEYEHYLRFSIVKFSDCNVKTASLPRSIDFGKIMPYYATSYSHNVLSNGIYLEETDDLDVFIFNSMSIHKYSINTEGIVSKVDNS
uniref:Da-p36 protein n=1 Tax=Trichogramma kaykai TaxID=54128 RepID=A0ABD2XAT1_9HYME